jgi:hypothetical protein
MKGCERARFVESLASFVVVLVRGNITNSRKLENSSSSSNMVLEYGLVLDKVKLSLCDLHTRFS